MKLRQLQCLCAVVDADFNISRAAVALHATQPAISKQLRQLEEELGVDLLLRQAGRVVELTAVGQRTVVWARRALQCAGNIRALAQEGRGDSDGCIVVATSHTHAKYVLLPVIQTFTRQHPRVRITVLQGTPDQVTELVYEGKAAIGVISVPSTLRNEVLAIPFQSSPLVLVTRVGHSLLKVRELTLDKLAAHPFIVISPSPLGTHVMSRFQQANLELDVTVQALNADVTQDFVAAGLGIAIIPSFTFSAARDRGLRQRSVGHLFDPLVSSVLLRRKSHLPTCVGDFLALLDARLDRHHLDAMIFQHD